MLTVVFIWYPKFTQAFSGLLTCPGLAMRVFLKLSMALETSPFFHIRLAKIKVGKIEMRITGDNAGEVFYGLVNIILSQVWIIAGNRLQ